MFIILNKSRINSYLISIGTVMILFSMSFMINKNMNFIETMSPIKEFFIYSVETNEKKVALTVNLENNIDDIDKILDILSKYKVHITFFISENIIDKYEKTVKKIYSLGHQISIYSNIDENNLSLEESINKIEKTTSKIEKITENKNYFYRIKSFLEYNNFIKALRIKKYEIVQWNIDTLDYIKFEKDGICRKIKENLKPGSIISISTENKNIIDALDMMIYDIKNEGYDIVKANELIYKNDYYIDENGIQKLINSNNE